MNKQTIKGIIINCNEKEQEQTNVIYYWTIKLANGNTYYYVGKTKQMLKDRNYQHLKKITKEYNNFNSLDLFLKENINNINNITVKVIDKANNSKELNNKEKQHTNNAKQLFGNALLNILNV